jgi:hypothetical protein
LVKNAPGKPRSRNKPVSHEQLARRTRTSGRHGTGNGDSRLPWPGNEPRWIPGIRSQAAARGRIADDRSYRGADCCAVRWILREVTPCGLDSHRRPEFTSSLGRLPHPKLLQLCSAGRAGIGVTLPEGLRSTRRRDPARPAADRTRGGRPSGTRRLGTFAASLFDYLSFDASRVGTWDFATGSG